MVLQAWEVKKMDFGGHVWLTVAMVIDCLGKIGLRSYGKKY